MADLSCIFWDDDGYAHTDCLYWEGFPRILWDTLRIFHYPEPPRYIGPFEIIETCGPVAYRIRLPSPLAAIHDVFHISQLNKCIKVPTKIIKPQDIEIEPDLSYAEYPIRVLDTKERSTRREKVKCTKSSGITILRKKPPGRLKLS